MVPAEHIDPWDIPACLMTRNPTVAHSLSNMRSKFLKGKNIPKDMKLPLPFLTNSDIILCKTGTWEEWKKNRLQYFSHRRKSRIPTLVPGDIPCRSPRDRAQGGNEWHAEF